MLFSNSSKAPYSWKKFKLYPEGGQFTIKPRTHNELENPDVLANAVNGATELQKDMAELEAYVQSLDNKRGFDFNSKDGEVLLKGVPYRDKMLEGTYKDGKLDILATRGEQRIGYERHGDSLSRTIYGSRERDISETLIGSENPIYHYAGPDRHRRFADFSHQQEPIPRPSRVVRNSQRALELGDNGQIMAPNPSSLKDLDELGPKLQAASEGNKAMNLVQAVYDAASQLDQTDGDKNDRPGEVLFDNLEVEGRNIRGTILPYNTIRSDFLYESLDYNQGTHSYLRAQDTATGETFELIDGAIDYEFRSDFDSVVNFNDEKTFIYDSGSQRTRVSLTATDLDTTNGYAMVALSDAPTPKKTWGETLQFWK